MDINYMNIKDSITNGAEVIAKKSQEFIEVSSLRMKIYSCENQINDLYNEIGEKYYKLYRHGKDENSSLRKICKKIDGLNSEINIINKKIRDMN